MKKPDIHNEWFQPVQKQAYRGGSRCPCGMNKADRILARLDPTMYSWGNYIATRWNNVSYCCENCFQDRIIPRLIKHAIPCGCTFELNARNGYSLPHWIKLPDTFNTACQVRQPVPRQSAQLQLFI
jgi:hypothetical protein